MLAEKYDANTYDSAVPLNSVRVGVGSNSDEANWQHGTAWV